MNPAPRCLLVDDEPSILRLGERILADGGFECRVASSADEALAILDAEEVDVMLTDIGMPGTDGLSLTRLVRARYPRTVVVMLTGRVDQEALDTALSAGAADYLAKPFNAAQLVAAVTRALEGRHPPSGGLVG